MNLPTGFSRYDVSTISMKDEVKGRNGEGEERAACKSTDEERKLQSIGSVLSLQQKWKRKHNSHALSFSFFSQC